MRCLPCPAPRWQPAPASAQLPGLAARRGRRLVVDVLLVSLRFYLHALLHV